ncbi:FUSC family protein [Tessaracoccus sp. G1721]
MASFATELLTLDRRLISVRAGLTGLAVLSVLAAAILIWGPLAMAAVIGALILLATDPPPAGRPWAKALLPLVVVGAALTYVAVWIDGRPVAAAVLVGVVGVATALHSGRSRKAGVRGLISAIWIILALTLHDTGVGPLGYAAGFAVGAAVGAGVAWLRAREGSDEGVGDDDVEAGTTAQPSSGRRGQLGSALGQFAVLRGLGLAVATLLGFTFFPAHPAWLPVCALLVMRPPSHQAFVLGTQRTLGTAVGVIIAVALTGLVGDNTLVLVLLFLGSAFLVMTFREVNYALFALLLTTLIVFSQRILGVGAAESGVDRLLETLLGVVIAFCVLGLDAALTRARTPAPER